MSLPLRWAATVVPRAEPDAGLWDGLLLDRVDLLLGERSRLPAAELLRENYRRLVTCCDSRQVSSRMRRSLVGFRNAGGVVSGLPGSVGDDGAPEERNYEILVPLGL